MKSRKIVALFMAAALIASMVVGCGSNTSSETTTEESEGETEEVAETAEATTEDESVYDDQVNFPGMVPCDFARTGEEPEPTTTTDHTLKVGFITTAADIFYNRIYYGITDTIAAKGYDMEFDYLAPSDHAAYDEPIELIENCVVQGYDAICLAVSDEAYTDAAVKAAQAEGIPVFYFNAPGVSLDICTSNIGYLQDTGGYFQGEYIGEYYEGEEDVKLGVVIGVPGDTASRIRTDGLYEALNQYDNIEVVAEVAGYWKRQEGADATEDLLQAHPDVDGIVVLFDDMGLGAYQVLEEEGLLGTIDLFGYDNMPEVYDLILEGKGYTSTTDTCTYVTGQALVEAVYQYCYLGNIIPKQIVFEPTVYDSSNMEEFDYLQYGQGPHE